MKNFRDLNVWQKSHELTLATYRHTSEFPGEERYGLTSQMRRSAASIGANIAEGCGRGSNSEFHKFLTIAMGSASELEYHLLLAKDLGYLDSTAYTLLDNGTVEVKRMLSSLLRRVDEDRARNKAAGL